MVWGDETVSARGGPQQLQVSPILMLVNTVFQAHDTSFLGIGTTTPGNQSFASAIVIATVREQLAEGQRDTISHRVARKHR
jgi:hypothetical protein